MVVTRAMGEKYCRSRQPGPFERVRCRELKPAARDSDRQQ
jgi:hypothetical protein